MIKKSLKTPGILKLFQFLLAFICVSAPITETQALFGWFKKKKPPSEKKKSRNKKDVSNQKKDKKKSKKTRARFPNQAKSKKTNTAAQSKKPVYKDLSKGKLQQESDKNVAKYLKSIGVNSTNTPTLEDLRNNTAKALGGHMHLVLPASNFYDHPTSEGEIVTVPLKPLKTMPLIEPSSKEFIEHTRNFLGDPNLTPKLDDFIRILEHSIQSMPKEKKIFEEKLLTFMELHKKYHDPKKCRLDFEQPKFNVLLDSSKKIESWVNEMKKNNPQDDQQHYKNSILTELNTIERILGYEETKKKIETTQFQKVIYSQDSQDQSKGDQINNSSVKKNLLLG